MGKLRIILTVIITLTLSVLGFVFAFPNLSNTQKETLLILGIVSGASALYCFVVGEITRNNSQMDKLWSILPIAYTWIVAVKGDFKPRLVLFAVVATLWGIRLTFNFARKGAYKLKFWEGEEDYRWSILRSNGAFKNRFVWALFDLFFISIYQNFIVLAITLPSLAVMDVTKEIGLFDFIAFAGALVFLFIETIADEQQMDFYNTRKMLMEGGKKLEEIPFPYSRGFNTNGLWSRARHPNYLGEQGIWLCLYLFVIGAGLAQYGIFHWSILGPMLLVLLFLGSSTMGESISRSKYPEYDNYTKHTSRYIPLWKYKGIQDEK